ncbi:MAG: hypothetical protein HYY84_12075 [Deltaproteobacteria bacterium]|nr:hypothetical protein [Deltaproteobacteria bacterium]
MGRAAVVRLESYRQAKRVDWYSRRLDEVVDNTRSTVAHLFESGIIFQPTGLKAGRGLLRAYENLLRIRSLLGRLKRLTMGRRLESGVVLDEIETLVDETNRLVEQTRNYISKG